MKLYAQTPSSTPETTIQTEEERRIKLVEALERAQGEVKAGRKYIDSLTEQRDSKQKIIDAQSKRQALADEAIAGLQSQIKILNQAIDKQQETISIQKSEIDYLKKELDKTNKKLKHARTLLKYLAVAAGVLLITSIFK